MRVYWLTPRDNVQLLEPIATEAYEIFRTLGNGNAYQGKWSPPKVKRLIKPRRRKMEPLCDLTSIAAISSVPVLSNPAKDLLDQYVGENGQWLALDFLEENYWIFNITKLSNALDPKHALIRFFPHGPVRDIETFSFRSNLIANELLFKIKEVPYYVLATDAFRELVIKYKFSGFYFQPVWDSEHEPFRLTTNPEYIKTRPDVFGPSGFVTNYSEYWPEEWKVEANQLKIRKNKRS
jgi:hypothetical protein